MTTKKNYEKKLRISFAILLILLFLNVFFFTDYIWIEKTLMIGTIIVLLILIFHDNKKGWILKMSYMVARMQKMKADNLVGIGNHNQRKTQNHSNKDIDVERSHLNYDLVEGRTEN